MLRSTLAALVLATLLTAAAPANSSWLPLVPGTLALYQFDEGSGTTSADGSGNGHTATLVNAPDWVAGLGGSPGIQCTLAEAYVDVSSIDLPATWTLQTWTRFPLAPTIQGWRTLAKFGESRHHVLVSGDGQLGVYVGRFFDSGYSVSALDGWHLLSAVAANSKTTFYIDAQQVGVSDTQETLPIRYLGNNEGPGQNWGAIDSLRILGNARSADDIALDANPTVPAPQALAQSTFAGAPIPAGGSAHGGFVATLTPGRSFSPQVRVDVELKPAGVPFDGVTGITSVDNVFSGSPVSLVIVGGSGGFHWRACSRDALAGVSPWTSFGTNPENNAETDISLANALPTGTAPEQRRGDGSVLPDGARTMDAAGLRMRVGISDADGDAVKLQVELVPTGGTFSGRVTAEGPLSSASAAECRFEAEAGSYQWSYRVVDAFGAATAWKRYGSGAASDFEVEWQGSSGPVGCLGSSTGGATAWALVAVALVALAAKGI